MASSFQVVDRVVWSVPLSRRCAARGSPLGRCAQGQSWACRGDAGAESSPSSVPAPPTEASSDTAPGLEDKKYAISLHLWPHRCSCPEWWSSNCQTLSWRKKRLLCDLIEYCCSPSLRCIKHYSKIGCRRMHVFRGQAGRSYLQAAFLSRSYIVQCRM